MGPPATDPVAEALFDEDEPIEESGSRASVPEFDLHGTWLRNADRMTARKSIVILGIPRGGTSLAASVFAQLGVPFSRRRDRQIGRRYEHRELRAAFEARNGAAITRIAREFSAEHDVWAWKFPKIYMDVGFVADLVPNPHFVLIFKEPLSVAMRKTDRHGRETLDGLKNVLNVYQQMTRIATAAEHPLLLISYERAMARMDPFIAEAANFAGIRDYDVEAVRAGIHEDSLRYFGREAAATEG